MTKTLATLQPLFGSKSKQAKDSFSILLQCYPLYTP